MKPLLISNKPSYKENIIVKEVEVPYLNTPLHFHNDYEIVFIIKSNGKRIVGDSIENFSDGDLIILGPNLPHVWYNEKDYYNKNSIKKVHAIVIYFQPNWLSEDFLQSFQATKLRDLIRNLNRGIKIEGTFKKNRYPQNYATVPIHRIEKNNIFASNIGYTGRL